MDEISFPPIGVVRRKECYRFETPRQGVFSGGRAFVEFFDTSFWREARRDLAGFERLWIIGVFHLNLHHNAKPLVHPPVAPEKRGYGVFATRSPHRPNPVALSCVHLLNVLDNGIETDECDLLDGTPVLDIKPYIPEADAFPASACGWRALTADETYNVSFLPSAAAKAEFLQKEGNFDLKHFAVVQLEHDPLNFRRKRLRELTDGSWELAWRTWRLRFLCDVENCRVDVVDIYSGYTAEELLPDSEDIYRDKELHRFFCRSFGTAVKCL